MKWFYRRLWCRFHAYCGKHFLPETIVVWQGRYATNVCKECYDDIEQKRDKAYLRQEAKVAKVARWKVEYEKEIKNESTV